MEMNKKAVSIYRLGRFSEIKQNLEYWLSKSPEERIETVEILRRRVYGNTERLQRVARVIQRPQS